MVHGYDHLQQRADVWHLILRFTCSRRHCSELVRWGISTYACILVSLQVTSPLNNALLACIHLFTMVLPSEIEPDFSVSLHHEGVTPALKRCFQAELLREDGPHKKSTVVWCSRCGWWGWWRSGWWSWSLCHGCYDRCIISMISDDHRSRNCRKSPQGRFLKTFEYVVNVDVGMSYYVQTGHSEKPPKLKQGS